MLVEACNAFYKCVTARSCECSHPGPEALLQRRAEVLQARVQGDARAPPGRLIGLALLLRVHAGPALLQQRCQLLVRILPSSLQECRISDLYQARKLQAPLTTNLPLQAAFLICMCCV